MFHESTPYDWMGIIEEGEVEIVRGLHGDEHLLYTLGKGSMVSEGAILGNTAHFASARTRTGARSGSSAARQWISSRQQNPEAYYRVVVARSASDSPIVSGLLSDTAVRRERFAAAAGAAPRARPARLSARSRAAPTTACRRCAPWRTSRSPASPLRDFAHFIDAFAFVKKAAALANCELGVLSEEKRDAIVQACDEIARRASCTTSSSST